jgi:hypothetical protein
MVGAKREGEIIAVLSIVQLCMFGEKSIINNNLNIIIFNMCLFLWKLKRA